MFEYFTVPAGRVTMTTAATAAAAARTEKPRRPSTHRGVIEDRDGRKEDVREGCERATSARSAGEAPDGGAQPSVARFYAVGGRKTEKERS